ncbi:hypothetical protein HIM_05674 [Hirsutella minnesotensis 3608]|uniref:Acyl-coenzyme A diphosphatase SCS3 n=1 Tax=Hirsutella minnesotensis 3608 TaxID=1043627 RepID=A0A0F7ZUI9_9HYPO|nr:hypothetical protein HIM_05674 [Hirsutella minnesotensis 3608]
MATRRSVDHAAAGPMEETRSSTPKISTTSAVPSTRNSPFLPTPLERLALALFPLILVFGTIFSLVSPETRSAPYDATSQSHSQDASAAPSYFARKSNIFNVVFVKRGWGWTTFAFVFFLVTHPSYGTGSAGSGFDLTPRRFRAGLRWAATTAWWFLITQWCFGPPIIDRGFRWTGGRCELAQREVEMGDSDVGEMLTAMACKAAGGRWKGGHDISGHVFLLVLGSVFLMHEVVWPVLRWSSSWREERCVIMPDGALKGATVEAGEMPPRPNDGKLALGAGGKAALAVMGLNLWMLLMTAIYFHTWFEKFTGLLTALTGWYILYILPRFMPGLRAIIGLPGI